MQFIGTGSSSGRASRVTCLTCGSERPSAYTEDARSGRSSRAVSPSCPKVVHRHSMGAPTHSRAAFPLRPPLSQSPGSGSHATSQIRRSDPVSPRSRTVSRGGKEACRTLPPRAASPGRHGRRPNPSFAPDLVDQRLSDLGRRGIELPTTGTRPHKDGCTARRPPGLPVLPRDSGANARLQSAALGDLQARRIYTPPLPPLPLLPVRIARRALSSILYSCRVRERCAERCFRA